MTTTTTKTFEQAYADAIISEMTNEQCAEACKIRQLRWHGERVSLNEAAELYAKIINGYNEFKPDMIAKLATEFEDCGIEVTPVREYSVAIYLHFPKDGVPGLPRLQSDVKRFVKKHFDADEVDVVDHFSCLQEGEAELDGEALRVWWD